MATIAAPPVTKTTLDVLRDARALYSENPSHAPVDETPANGTYCVTTAMDDVVRRALLRSAAGGNPAQS